MNEIPFCPWMVMVHHRARNQHVAMAAGSGGVESCAVLVRRSSMRASGGAIGPWLGPSRLLASRPRALAAQDALCGLPALHVLPVDVLRIVTGFSFCRVEVRVAVPR